MEHDALLESTVDVTSQPNRAQKRRKVETSRRSTNACHRCKGKKLKCHFDAGETHSCVACRKAKEECVFNVAPDGVPRGSAYIAMLEDRINLLESDLQSTQAQVQAYEDDRRTSHDIPEAPRHESPASVSETRHASSNETRRVMDNVAASRRSARSTLAPARITIFNLLSKGCDDAKREVGNLPRLPSMVTANELLESVYRYTQPRYCIVDWNKVRRWHEKRDAICYATSEDHEDSQIGAYFLWMTYAIGSRFIRNPEHSPKAYYARALDYLSAAITPQNLTSVQALLVLVQYCFRAYGGPSIWNIVGAATRLSVELGYHRQMSVDDALPLDAELQKRSFWCAYAFDRLVSIVSNRPFSIHDRDIDVQLPIDIDIECVDQEIIRRIQSRQATEDIGYWGPDKTSMSSCLHNLHMWRIRSKIVTQFTGPHALHASYDVVVTLLSELDSWKQNAPPWEGNTSKPTSTNEHHQAFYLQAMINLMRPVLSRSSYDPNLLNHFADLSADACENAKILSLSPDHQASPIQVYSSFHCGITLLQCLVVRPAIQPLARTLRAITACSSALSVYTRSLAAAMPFLQLFDKLCDLFLSSSTDSTTSCLSNDLQNILQRIISSDPSEIPDILSSLGNDQAVQQCSTHQLPPTSTDGLVRGDKVRQFELSGFDRSQIYQYDCLWSTDYMTAFDTYDIGAPTEHFEDAFPAWS